MNLDDKEAQYVKQLAQNVRDAQNVLQSFGAFLGFKYGIRPGIDTVDVDNGVIIIGTVGTENPVEQPGVQPTSGPVGDTTEG